MRPFPSRDDVAMELISANAERITTSRRHGWRPPKPRPIGTVTSSMSTGWRAADVETVKVTRWHAPDPLPRRRAPARSYASITEVSCLFRTGYVVLREIGGRILDLPPLPAGHGDYRLRFHVGEAGCLLQIGPQPRGKPRARV